MNKKIACRLMAVCTRIDEAIADYERRLLLESACDQAMALLKKDIANAVEAFAMLQFEGDIAKAIDLLSDAGYGVTVAIAYFEN